MPFSEETLEFLVRNRLQDSRPWFHEHRAEYEALVLGPMAELACALAPAILEIDPDIPCIPKVGKCISRIWRDTRRGPELPIFRDVMWLSFTREKYGGLPGFFLELSPRLLRWGCGWYATAPDTVREARRLILADSPLWKKADAVLQGSGRFVLEDESYKKSRYPDEPERRRLWLDQRSYCLTHYEPDLSLLFSPALAETAAADFRALAPVYRFFTAAWSAVPRN